MMFDTHLWFDCIFSVFDVSGAIVFKIDCVVTNVVDIVMAIRDFYNLHMDYFRDIYSYALYSSENVLESNYISSKSMFTATMTIFDELLHIFIIVGEVFINCIMSLQNDCISCYKFICCYCWTLIHAQMMVLAINQLELIIYCIIIVIKSNFKYANYEYCQNKSSIKRNTHYYKLMCCNCTSMNYYVMLIVQDICMIYLLLYFMDINVIKANYINSQSIFTPVITIFDELLDIFIIFTTLIINCVVLLQNCCKSQYRFIYWHYCTWIHLRMASSLTNPMKLMIYSTFDVIESNVKDTMDIYRQNKSQNNKNIHSYNIISCASINCISMVINDVICTIYPFYSLMNLFSIEKKALIYPFKAIVIIIKLIGYQIALYYQCNQFKMKDYLIHENKSQNTRQYKFNGNMHCVTIDCILMCIMRVIWMIYFVYQLKNFLLFQRTTLLYYFIPIIIVLIVYSILLYYYNQKMQFYLYITYCIVFIIVVSDLWCLTDVYQLVLLIFIVISCIVVSFGTIIIEKD